MNFSTTGRLIVSILTVITILACLALSVYAFTASQIGLGIVAVVLAGFFGIFSYKDYLHYFKHQG